MDALLEPLLHSPKLRLYLTQLQNAVAEEQCRREQFWRDVRDDQKAEFINGEVIMHSPVKMEHNYTSGFLYQLLNVYVRIKKLGFVGFEKIFISLTRNDYEPDICFFGNDKAQHFNRKQMKFPAPDFIAEVLSPSTEKDDRGVKFEDYAAHGVGEYWILDPEAETIEQYVLRDGAYFLHVKVTTGTIRSLAIEGFEIPVRAVFDEHENISALQKILHG